MHFSDLPVRMPALLHAYLLLPSSPQTIPTVDDGANITLAAMARHGVSRAAIIGHSYGTCIAARIVKTAPQVVHTIALIDPVGTCGVTMLPQSSPGW